MKLRNISLLLLSLLAFGCARTDRVKDVSIVVAPNNEYTIQGKTRDSSTIAKELSDIAQKSSSRMAIHFLCDAHKPFDVLSKVIEPATRLGVWSFSVSTSPEAPPADCSRPAPDPSGGTIYNYTIRVYPTHLTINGTNSTLAQIDASLRSTGNNYVTVIPKEDVSVGEMYNTLRVCKDNAKVLGVCTIDYEMESKE
jgi:hypothetical protein